MGLGGEGLLRSHGRDREAYALVNKALDLGINYFESARAYDGSEEYYGKALRERRKDIFLAGKSHARTKQGALEHLHDTLRNLKTDHLDLWQIHDVRTFPDIRELEGPTGALSAFIEARETGVVRHIGVTGHHDPDVLSHAVENWPVDAVMLPANPVEGALGGFLTSTLTTAKEQGVAVIGMKVLGKANYLVPDAGVTPETLVRYALAQEISVAIVGCSTPAEVRALAAAGRSGPLADDEAEALVEAFRPYARELAYYRGHL